MPGRVSGEGAGRAGVKRGPHAGLFCEHKVAETNAEARRRGTGRPPQRRVAALSGQAGQSMPGAVRREGTGAGSLEPERLGMGPQAP